MDQPAVVGRLAPSPTGALHLGHALSFLVAWWHARSQGGRVVLRLEDVDVERAALEHCDAAKRDLEWLGLDWDEPVRLQSADVSRIVSAAEGLAAQGLAYACVCTRSDLRPLGAPQAGTAEGRYMGRCRGVFEDLSDAEGKSGREAGLRFVVPPGPVAVSDENFGARRYDVAAEVGDFLILRRNKMPAYQLAVVVDDAADGVTEVVRGSDLLPSTARQRLLAAALGLQPPRYFHVPLLLDETGRRLAKREAALGLSELRALGTDPRAIVGFVAEVTGQCTSKDTRAQPSDFLASFRPQAVGTNPIVLSAERLAALRAAR